MIYLILAALCSASMAVALRLSEGYSSNKDVYKRQPL